LNPFLCINALETAVKLFSPTLFYDRWREKGAKKKWKKLERNHKKTVAACFRMPAHLKHSSKIVFAN
jgi:hypothetical protein